MTAKFFGISLYSAVGILLVAPLCVAQVAHWLLQSASISPAQVENPSPSSTLRTSTATRTIFWRRSSRNRLSEAQNFDVIDRTHLKVLYNINSQPPD